MRHFDNNNGKMMTGTWIFLNFKLYIIQYTILDYSTVSNVSTVPNCMMNMNRWAYFVRTRQSLMATHHLITADVDYV